PQGLRQGQHRCGEGCREAGRRRDQGGREGRGRRQEGRGGGAEGRGSEAAGVTDRRQRTPPALQPIPRGPGGIRGAIAVRLVSPGAKTGDRPGEQAAPLWRVEGVLVARESRPDRSCFRPFTSHPLAFPRAVARTAPLASATRGFLFMGDRKMRVYEFDEEYGEYL